MYMYIKSRIGNNLILRKKEKRKTEKLYIVVFIGPCKNGDEIYVRNC